MELRSSMRNSNGYGLRVTIPNNGFNGPDQRSMQVSSYGQAGGNNFVSPRSGYLQSPMSATAGLGFNRSMEYNK